MSNPFITFIILVSVYVICSICFYDLGKKSGFEDGRNEVFTLFRNLILYDSNRFSKIIKESYPGGLTQGEQVGCRIILTELENVHGIEENENTDTNN